MALASIATGEQVTVINTEHSLVQNTTVGVFVLSVDVSNMELNDTVEIRINTTCRPADPLKLVSFETLINEQSEKIYQSIPVPLASGDSISCTIKQTTGSSRSFPWNLRRM